MLGARQLGLTSKSQSSIRHQVRKLRAKVKALIPEQICNHFEKRNHQVQKINLRRTQFKELLRESGSIMTEPRNRDSESSGWKYGRQKYEEYHVFTQPKKIGENHHKYQFEKLSPDQIDIINQDKIYYLGEKNVDAYNNYLKTLKSKIYSANESKLDMKSSKQTEQKFSSDITVLRKGQSVSLFDFTKNGISRTPNIIRNKQSSSMQIQQNKIMESSRVHNTYKVRNSTTSISKYNSQGFINRHRKRDSVDTKKYYRLEETKSFQKRKQEQDEDQRQKRIYQKIKIDMQMAKAQQNQRQNKYKLFSKIKEMRNLEKQRHDNAIKKKSILMKKAEIIKFDQELRSIMIKRRNIDSQRTNGPVTADFQIMKTES